MRILPEHCNILFQKHQIEILELKIIIIETQSELNAKKKNNRELMN